jgi:hypothetical protein
MSCCCGQPSIVRLAFQARAIARRALVSTARAVVSFL